MVRLIVQTSTSLDDFIADDNDGIGSMFDWMSSGDVEYVGNDPKYPLKVSRASADYLGSLLPTLRCEVAGRWTFNLTNGWNGIPPVRRTARSQK